MAQMRDLADRVLQHQRPLKKDFLVVNEGSLERCRQHCRSLQGIFSAMRAQDRQREQTLLAARGSVLIARSKYDDLACYYRTLPDDSGYELVFDLAGGLVGANDFVFADTGEAVPELNKSNARAEAIDAQIKRDARSVVLDDYWWLADHWGGMDELFIGMVAAACALQHAREWFEATFEPAARARMGQPGTEASSEPAATEPATDDVAGFDYDSLGEL
jgi:hypothetical protein